MQKRMFALLIFVCVGLVLSNFKISSVHAETGLNDDTPREYWARMLWANVTNAVVNDTFPFVQRGSTSYTNTTINELLAGAILYGQTGNSTYITDAMKFADWLNEQSDKRRLWKTYNIGTYTWSTTMYGMTSANALEQLAWLTYYCSKYKPLLQTCTDMFITLFIPLNTSRMVGSVNDSNETTGATCYSDYQASGIRALSLVSMVLNNATIKDIAYNMIMNYTLGTINLPYGSIKQDGTYDGINCKEDENFGEYLCAVEMFLYYYPDNTTIKNRIYDVAWAGSQYMWNSEEERFSYQTNADTGATTDSRGVHGFGMTDEALIIASLMWNNATWKDRAIQDFDKMVIQGAIIYNGLISHSTSKTDESDDYWNVFARRTANIIYCLTNNQTFLDYGNFLFMNATLNHARTLGFALAVKCSDGSDHSSYINIRFETFWWLSYVNRTTVTINSWIDIFDSFGTLYLGNINNEYENPSTTGLITWYMRSNTHTVNNVTTYQLNETNTESYIEKSNSRSGYYTVYFGFRAYVQYTSKVVELTSGTPTALMWRVNDGEGYQNSVLTVGNQFLEMGFSAVKLEVYTRIGEDGNWQLLATFITKCLLKTGILGSTWTFSIYTNHTYANGNTYSYFKYGNNGYGSAVYNVQLKEPTLFDWNTYKYRTGDLIGGILNPYTYLIGNLFYGILLLIICIPLYHNYHSFTPILFMFIILGGAGVGINRMIPEAGLQIAWLLIVLGLGGLLYKALR